MTQAELIAALAPSRLPPGLMQPGWREMLALLALGLLAGLVLSLPLRLLMRRRLGVAARIRATRGQPTPERLLSIARILGRLPPGLSAAAYGAAPAPDAAEVERRARRRR